MATQPTTVTSKGQVTIPKRIRDAQGIIPGSSVVFDVNDRGEIVMRAEHPVQEKRPDRFDLAVGSSQIKWNGTTDEYMEWIRGYSDDPR